MGESRWERLQALFEQAADMDRAERGAFLEQECAGDPELRRELSALLDADTSAGDEGREDSHPSRVDEIAARAIVSAADGVSRTQTDQTVGKQVGPYEIERGLGSGGMGVVYLARRKDEAFEKQVAVKVLRAGLDNHEAELRFRAERQILADLDHPNIARVLDGGSTDDGTPYVVMEYIEGEPLDTYCDKRKLSNRERLELFRKVCSAVQHAHRNLIVHRDLKPGNILVTGEGEPKLLDFGIAKLLDPARSPHTLPQTRAMMNPMTPEYASPEQVLGETLTTASDVYALGVVLYELLTGVAPFELRTHQRWELEEVICNTEPERPSTAIHRLATGKKAQGSRPAEKKKVSAEKIGHARNTAPDRLHRELEGDLDNIVMMALRKEPERRYASAERLSADIANYLDGHPVSAQTDSWRYRSSKFVRRNKLGVAAAAVMAGLVVTFGVSMAVAANRLAEERDVAERERLKAERSLELLNDVFKLADPNQSLGETVTARELLDRGAEKLLEGTDDTPEVQAELLWTIGRAYKHLALYDRALHVLEQGLERSRPALGDHRAVMSLNQETGYVLQAMGRYDEAEARMREGLAMGKKLQRRQKDGNYLSAGLNDLGHILFKVGRLEESEELLRESLALARKQDSNELESMVPTLDNLAQLLTEKGQQEEAEALFREALAFRSEGLGENHPDLLITKNNLGILLNDMKRHEESEAMLRECVEASRLIHGDHHPQVSTSLSNLSLTLQESGDLDGAESALREALAIQAEVHGKVHPDYQATLGNLATLLNAAGRAADAEAAYRESLDLAVQLEGPASLDVAIQSNNLGKFLAGKGRLDEAAALLRRTVEILGAQLGEDHPFYAFSLGNLADLLLKQGKHEQARRRFAESLRLRGEIYGKESADYATGLWNIAQFQVTIGEVDEAIKTLRRTLALREQVLSADHLDLFSTLASLGSLINESAPEEAEPMLRRAWEGRKAALPEGHWRIGAAESLLGQALVELDRQEEGLALLESGYRMVAAALGDEDPQTERARDRLEMYRP